MKAYLAVDIGASSGRHIVGWLENGELCTEEIYRFPNQMDEEGGHLIWDTDRLVSEVKEGLRLSLEKYPDLVSMSVDTWGVDYVLMRGDTEVKPTYAYRDSRTEESIPEVHRIVPFEELYSRTGIQFNSFNTVYQLYHDKMEGRLDGVTDFLMIPEYIMYKLTGVKKKEFTNATTGALVNADTLKIDGEIIARLGLPDSFVCELSMPGETVGRLAPEVRAEVGGDIEVVLCATHDTGSAVEAIPMVTDSPYISSGTWSLLGVKTPRALTDEKSRESGYSNEGGVGYNRYQINITGMWIIQCLRAELCPDKSFADIAKMAAKSKYESIFNVNDSAFLAPKSMKDAISSYFAERAKALPIDAADYFNSAYHSLAYCYNDAIIDLEANTGRAYSEIYIVGGGAKNGYLNTLTEEYTSRRVVALPIEATAIGNLRVQIKRNGEEI